MYRLDIDSHYPEALAGVGHAEKSASWRPGDFATHDHPVARNQNFLNLEFQVGDGSRKAADDLDRCITTPALAGEIAGTGLIIRRQDFFLQRLHVTLDGQIKQLVPGSDNGSGLWFGEISGHGWTPDKCTQCDEYRDMPPRPAELGNEAALIRQI